MTRAMRAAWYECAGPAAEVLAVGQMPVPVPGPGEVLVRMAASGVNPSDVKSRGAVYGSALAFERIIPHSDGAGTVESVGAGVDAGLLGRRVWLYDAQFGRAHGTAAEYVALPASLTEPLPDAVGFTEAACFGIPFRTAHRAVALGGDLSGRWVLVTGGAGAVGFFAVQLARARGARVIATVSSEAKAEHARLAGAEATIDYRCEDVAARVASLTGGKGVVHVVEVDLTRNAGLLPKLIAPGASVAVYGSFDPDATIPATQLRIRGASLHFYRIYASPVAHHRAAVADLNALLAEGRLIHAVAARYPLEHIAEAHDAVAEGRVIGNVVVEP